MKINDSVPTSTEYNTLFCTCLGVQGSDNINKVLKYV